MNAVADGQPAEEPEPDNSAVRVALWRALHVEIDAPPHVFQDRTGLRLAGPAENWRTRPDMDPTVTRRYRAAIVARARFVEDLVAERADQGVDQYVILGAGLDTFAQRRLDSAAGLRVFEVDRPGPQAWKRRRLAELGFGVPDRLRLVPVDFEVGESWWEGLLAAGFDADRPAVVASTGVSVYLTKEANAATLRRLASLAPGSALAMTFMLPADFVAEEDRPVLKAMANGARENGTPFLSYFSPQEALSLALDAGFKEARHVSADAYNERYFAGRTDGLRMSKGEELLVATV